MESRSVSARPANIPQKALSGGLLTSRKLSSHSVGSTSEDCLAGNYNQSTAKICSVSYLNIHEYHTHRSEEFQSGSILSSYIAVILKIVHLYFFRHGGRLKR